MVKRCMAALALIVALILPAARAEEGVYSPNRQYDYLVGSTVWQLSAESRALMLQAFSGAERRIEEMAALCADETETAWRMEETEDGGKAMLRDGKRVAVICDIDDTLVDGACYTANILGMDGDFNNAAFTRFVLSDACAALPGAVKFAECCMDNGVEVYYVTNRYDQGYKIGQSDSAGGYPAEGGGMYFGRDGAEIGTTTYQVFGMSFYDITLTRMRALGFPIDEEHLILHDGKVFGGTKESARAAIRDGAKDFPNGQRADGNSTCSALTVSCDAHYVAMLLGDQTADFTDDFEAEGLDAVSRAALTEKYAEKWGAEWIVLPNAVYGKALDYAAAYGMTDLLHAYDYTNPRENGTLEAPPPNLRLRASPLRIPCGARRKS